MQLAERRARQTHLRTAPRPFERRRPRTTDARPERRDARQHRAHRPLRRRLVPRARQRRASRARCSSPWAAPSRGPASPSSRPARRCGPRSSAAAGSTEPPGPSSSAATSAPGCRPRPRSTPRSPTPACGRSAPRSAHARSRCSRRPAAASPRPRGSPTTWPRESAGQCGPCVFGLARDRRRARLARRLRRRDARGRARALRRLAPQVTGRGACAHPNGATRLVASALTVFADEISAPPRGRCSARSHEPLLPIPPTTAEWR